MSPVDWAGSVTGSGVTINRDYDRWVRFLHAFSRVRSVSYYNLKSESRRFRLTSKDNSSSYAILSCLAKMLSSNHPLRISK